MLRGEAMPYLLVRHKVEDYAKWKRAFDEHAAARKVSGSKGGKVFRSVTNPNEIVILLEWETLADARKFTSDSSVAEAMERAGVTDVPDVYFLDEVAEVPE
jgi:heme-degrading monooxygenase HmoA